MDVRSGQPPTTDLALRAAAWVYLVGLVGHTADHLRRGIDVVTIEVLTLGAISTIAGLLTVAMIFRRHPRAPLAAMLFGFQLGIGVTVVHLLPEWSSFSDAFPGSASTGVTAASWTVVLIEIAGGFALGFAGAFALQREKRRQLA